MKLEHTMIVFGRIYNVFKNDSVTAFCHKRLRI